MILSEIERKINLIEDLRELQEIQGFIKDRRTILGSRIKYSLVVGDNVIINSNGKK